MSTEKPKRLDRCPKCRNTGLRTCWANGRRLKQECRDPDDVGCEWKGRPFIPEKKPILSVKTVHTDQGGWEYEGFDQYGHTFCVSEGFNSKAACIEAARKEVRRMSQIPDYGKCVAIVWPPTTTVRGTRIT